MSVFFHQYFDLDIIRENFSFVLKGFGQTVELSILSAALALMWGLVLALLRASPGRAMLPESEKTAVPGAEGAPIFANSSAPSSRILGTSAIVLTLLICVGAP